MKPLPPIAAAAGLAVLLTAGAASASEWSYGGSRYVTTYRPETHYVRRTIIVRERVWRPVRHRVHYQRSYAPRYDVYRPRYSEGYGDWARHREHERWEHEGWDHPW